MSLPSWPSSASAPAPRVEDVVAEAAEEGVGLVAAGEPVVAGAAVGLDGDQAADAGRDVERVVAAERVELEHSLVLTNSSNGALVRR